MERLDRGLEDQLGEFFVCIYRSRDDPWLVCSYLEVNLYPLAFISQPSGSTIFHKTLKDSFDSGWIVFFAYQVIQTLFKLIVATSEPGSISEMESIRSNKDFGGNNKCRMWQRCQRRQRRVTWDKERSWCQNGQREQRSGRGSQKDRSSWNELIEHPGGSTWRTVHVYIGVRVTRLDWIEFSQLVSSPHCNSIAGTDAHGSRWGRATDTPW